MGADLVVGITPLGHDLSMTIARPDGRIVFVAEEERYSGIKGGRFAFHPSRLKEVLAEAGYTPADIAVLAPVGTPAASIEDGNDTVLYPSDARQRHLDAWLAAYKRLLRNARHLAPIRHHRAHAASTYYVSGLDDAAVVTIDGHGNGECCTISYGSGSEIRLLERQLAPDSISYLYRATATYLGFRGHEREGKLMALAAYGTPRLAARLAGLFFDRPTYPARATEEVRALPCRQDAWVARLAAKLGPPRGPGTPLDPLHLDIAASVQRIFTDYIMSVLEHARRLTGASACCAAGGAFVNSVANGFARQHGPFKTLLLPAWASDAGLSVGAAAAALAERHVRLVLPDSYVGSELAIDTVPSVAGALGLSCTAIADPAATAADLVVSGRIVGWAQGRLELGPRALGNRSVLGHPAIPHIRHELNRRKSRESWRPFGASVLSESGAASPYMNVTFDSLDPDAYRAALHVDGSCRLHTVTEDSNTLFARLLRKVHERTGVAAVINTSLNRRGQPIARTVEECLQTYVDLGLDAMIIGDYMISGRRMKPRAVESPRGPQEVALPPSFDLVVPFRVNAFPIPAWLEGRAARVIERLDLLRTPHDRHDAKHPIVIYHPWFNAVAFEMLPRVIAWARSQAGAGEVVRIFDSAGEILSVEADVNGSKSACTAPPTDVEGHLMRCSARLHAPGDAQVDWFPET